MGMLHVFFLLDDNVTERIAVVNVMTYIIYNLHININCDVLFEDLIKWLIYSTAKYYDMLYLNMLVYLH